METTHTTIYKRFILETLRDPRAVGAVAPSSKRLTDLIVNNASLSEVNSVVEIGPGTGVFTLEIKRAIKPEAKFFTIESNPQFVDMLHEGIPVVETYYDSAVNLKHYLEINGLDRCDRIISGLPWTSFNSELQKELIDVIYSSLEEGGKFLTFAYSPLNNLRNGRTFKKLLQSRFSEVSKTEVVLNVPPAFVYVCTK